MEKKEKTPEYREHYERGWRCRGSDLDDSQDRYCRRYGSTHIAAWEDGYFDFAAAREKWATPDGKRTADN